MHTNEATMPLSPSATALKYLGMRRYQLAMEGRFDPGWICGLSHGLAQRRINITRVEELHGVLGDIGSPGWNSISMQLNCLQMRLIIWHSANRLPRFRPWLNRLCLMITSERSARCEGSLYLEASGPDRLGVLSSLLNTFSLFSLFPAEMLVETKNKRIFDRFWLKGMGGSSPSREAVSALRERMQGFVAELIANACLVRDSKKEVLACVM